MENVLQICLSLMLCQNNLESLAVPLDVICISDSVTVCYL